MRPGRSFENNVTDIQSLDEFRARGLFFRKQSEQRLELIFDPGTDLAAQKFSWRVLDFKHLKERPESEAIEIELEFMDKRRRYDLFFSRDAYVDPEKTFFVSDPLPQSAVEATADGLNIRASRNIP